MNLGTGDSDANSTSERRSGGREETNTSRDSDFPTWLGLYLCQRPKARKSFVVAAEFHLPAQTTLHHSTIKSRQQELLQIV